jgi:hypothetical protein
VHFVGIVRTVVVTVSPLLADLVIDVLRPRLRVEVAAILPTRERLADHLQALMPDLVVLGIGDTESDEIVGPLATALPTAMFLVVAANARQAWLHGTRPNREVLNDFSVADLVEALSARFPSDPSQG